MTPTATASGRGTTTAPDGRPAVEPTDPAPVDPTETDRSGRPITRRTADADAASTTPGDPMAKRPKPVEEPTSPPTEPRELPLVALRETVIFPEMIVPLQVGREKSVNALNAAVADGGPIALVTQRQAEHEEINDPSELYAIGTLAKIAQVVQLQDGTVRAIVQGQGRLRVHGFIQTDPYIIATRRGAARRTPRRASRSRRSCGPSRPRSSSTSRPARRCRRRRPSPPATSPSRACSPTWWPTART